MGGLGFLERLYLVRVGDYRGVFSLELDFLSGFWFRLSEFG